MPGAYSTDLRKRVLAAVEAGESPDAVAARFMVGRATVYRWLTAARDEGGRAPKPASGGLKPVIQDRVKAALVHMVRESNHLTLSECRDRLAAETGVRVHPCTGSRALRRLPWT
jgi:transposase